MSKDASQGATIVKKSEEISADRYHIGPRDMATPEGEYTKLLEKLKRYMPEAGMQMIERAYHFAVKFHGAQKRQTGEAYVTHPIAVAGILADLNLDQASIIAALLHDTVEDTEATLSDLEREFGKSIADLVDGLTKLGKVRFRSNQEKLAENFRKMILAMAKDLRVIVVKLADRLHNMRTIGAVPPVKAKRIAQETLDIYAPLANRLGIYGIKSELEDLCLRELKGDVYQEIRKKIAAKKSVRQAYIEDVKAILETELHKYGFKNVEVYGRPKHFYSIYKKMQERRLDFEDINDLFAFRIIVDSIKDCYEALGIVHAMWKPMPGRFKDYIAMPKANMYQSLHTTVIRPNGEPAEIQIRTREMQRVCEFGVAAHWAYKEKKDAASGGADELQKFSWLRQIMQWQSELKDPDEFLEAVKVDLFDEEIFVFTPKGDVISLPAQATALDFAFAVHSNVGLRASGAKVNSRIVPFKKVLRSGDIVEVITSPTAKPSKDWLNFVVTSKAKNKIRSALRSDQREESRTLGRNILEQLLEKRGWNIARLQKGDFANKLVEAAKESTFDDVLISVGYGKIDLDELLKKVVFPQELLMEQEQVALKKLERDVHSTEARSKEGRSSSGVIVSGFSNVLITPARCCTPLPGEDIIGIVTRGKGVAIHRSSCARALDIDPGRRIDVRWSTDSRTAVHNAYIRVITRDKPGVLAEVTQAVASCGANIQRADIRVGADMLGTLDFELGISDLQQLEAVIRRIENLTSVVTVERKSVLKLHRES